MQVLWQGRGRERARAVVDQSRVCSAGRVRGSGAAGGSAFIGLLFPGARARVWISAIQKALPTPASHAAALITGCGR